MLDDHWEQVGEVDTANEPDAQRFWQGIWRVKAAPRGKSAKFYIMVDPRNGLVLGHRSRSPDTTGAWMERDGCCAVLASVPLGNPGGPDLLRDPTLHVRDAYS